MAISPYTTNELVSLVKNLEAIPTNQNTFTNADFVQLMNHTLQQDILPEILAVDEEYFVAYEDFQVGEGSTELAIPPTAIGMRARDVQWLVDSQNWVTMPRLMPSVIGGNYAPITGVAVTSPGYYLRSNKIIFYPQPVSSGTVRVLYFRRPNQLTLEENSANVVSKTSTEITLDTITSDMIVGANIDIIHSYQPFDFAVQSVEVTNVSSLTLTIGDTSNVEIGDTVTIAGLSIYPQFIPLEAHGPLVQGTALKALQSLNDTDAIKVAASVYNGQMAGFIKMITPRVQGQVKKIGNTGRGIVGSGGMGRSYFGSF